MPCRLLFLLLAVSVVVAQDLTTHAGAYLAQGYLSKAADLAVPPMLSSLRSYSHAALLQSPLVAAPQCTMTHNELTVQSVSFDSLLITPINATFVRVDLQGVTPLQTTTGSFAVTCQYQGVFQSALQLPQNGSVSFAVSFEPSLSFEMELVITGQGLAKLQPPVLRSNVRAQPTYAYDAQGFALDVFVAHHFATTVTQAIQDEVTTLISYPSPFAAAFTEQVNAALSVFQYLCGTPTVYDDIPQAPPTVALWMQSACRAPQMSVNVTTQLLQNHDLMVLFPSTAGEERMEGALVRHVRALRSRWLQQLPPSAMCQSGIPCPPVMNATTSLSIAFSNCTVCYPNNGNYTEFAAVVTMLP